MIEKIFILEARHNFDDTKWEGFIKIIHLPKIHLILWLMELTQDKNYKLDLVLGYIFIVYFVDLVEANKRVCEADSPRSLLGPEEAFKESIIS